MELFTECLWPSLFCFATKELETQEIVGHWLINYFSNEFFFADRSPVMFIGPIYILELVVFQNEYLDW